MDTSNSVKEVQNSQAANSPAFALGRVPPPHPPPFVPMPLTATSPHGVVYGPPPTRDVRVFGEVLGRITVPEDPNPIPLVVDHCLQVLSLYCPSPPDLFELPLDDSNVLSLRAFYDTAITGLENHVSSYSNPQVAAGLLVLFFKSLPIPVVPAGRFFPIFVHVNSMKNRLLRFKQYRVLLYSLPPVCRAILVPLLRWFHRSGLPIDLLIHIFGEQILRPQVQPSSLEPSAEAVLRELIEQAEYLCFDAASPTFSDPVGVPQMMDMPPSISDFRVEAVIARNVDGNDGNFGIHDRIRLIDAASPDLFECQRISDGLTGLVRRESFDLAIRYT